MLKKLFSAQLCAIVLGGCSAVKVTDYAQEQPKLDLKQYFNGKFTAHGMFVDRSGKVVKRFVIAMDTRWVGDTGTLDESYLYSDGSIQKRIWTIKKSGDRYVATAADIVGEAIAEASGNAVRWRYVMALPVDGKTYHVDFDDWMYLIDEKVLLNKSAMSKFGFHLGDVVLSITKP
jgi:Protein of unknown function (DUF3833)